jgi:hypothetical protein
VISVWAGPHAPRFHDGAGRTGRNATGANRQNGNRIVTPSLLDVISSCLPAIPAFYIVTMYDAGGLRRRGPRRMVLAGDQEASCVIM